MRRLRNRKTGGVFTYTEALAALEFMEEIEEETTHDTQKESKEQRNQTEVLTPAVVSVLPQEEYPIKSPNRGIMQGKPIRGKR